MDIEELNNIVDTPKMSIPGVAAANPVLYFLMKYRYAVIISALVVMVGALVFGAWKYHEYMNKKLVAVNIEMTQYKDQANVLTETMKRVREDIAIAAEQRQQFEKDIIEIRRANAEIRKRIHGFVNKIPPGTLPAEAQSIVDEIRNDINQRWISIRENPNEE